MLPTRLRLFVDRTRVRLQQLFSGQGPATRLGGWGTRSKLIAGAIALFLLSLPFWAGALARRIAIDKVESRLGARLSIGTSRLWYTRLVLDKVSLGQGPGGAGQAEVVPLAVIKRVVVPVSVAWGSGTIQIEGARFEILHRGPGDNVSALLERLRGKRPSSGESTGGTSSTRLPPVMIRDAHLRARDTRYGAVVVDGLDVDLTPGKELVAQAAASAGIVRVRGGDGDPKFGAGRVRVVVPLQGLRPLPEPTLEMSGGYLQPLPDLGLTGIKGSMRPGPGEGQRPLIIAFEGSYGGAREVLWTASGQIAPPAEGQSPAGNISIRAARFSLDRIKDVLPPTVLKPQETTIDAALDLSLLAGKVGFRGNIDVSGLNLHHEAVSAEPVMGLALGVSVDGSLDPARRRLELGKLEGKMRGLTGILSGLIELREGKFKFTDGSELAMVPLIELQFRVPKMKCEQLLESIPAPIIPNLQGFGLQGIFEANVFTKIDYTNLEALELGGKVGIDGCKVLKAPPEVTALAGPDSITQLVEIPSADKDAPPGTVDMLAFTVGPDNPNFVPYDRISPHLISSIMTTEDNGFFKHRGWVSPEFKTALRRNLQGGGFRLGASSITMQMVKNVLLSRQKTLSRKLQELFLVWYIEQLLPKERILELYFNAIEFGPRLYGIGPAAHHYFGKEAADLTPLEAAFFSSILPSPKRRYVQYCHGQLFPPWDKYVRKILAKIYERGRITEEEYGLASVQPLVFDPAGRGPSEADCLAWIKKNHQSFARGATYRTRELKMWALGADFLSTPRATLTYLSVVKQTLFFALALCVVGLAGSNVAWAKAAGFSGDSCTGCHRGGTPFAPKISADPAVIGPGESTTITVTFPGSVGGFFINSNQKGAFTEIAGEGTQKASETGVTHRNPKPASGGQVSFKMKWTAPSAGPGGVDFDVTALSGNGDNRTSGDIEGIARFNFSFGCEGVNLYLDQDGDGWGLTDQRGPQRRCAMEPGWAMKPGDCNDYDKNANPEGMEICNLYDDDCDGMVNEGLDAVMVYRDEDGDGHGARFNAETQVGCGNGAGWSSLKDDCDDKDRMIYPGRKEVCNYKDDNCNNRVDEGSRASCGVGWCRREASSCEMNAVCTPNQPRAEMCNGLDEDCNDVIDDGPNLCPEGQACYKAQCIPKDVAAEMAAKDPPPPPPRDAGADSSGSSGSGGTPGGTSEPGGNNGTGSDNGSGSPGGEAPRPGLGCSYGSGQRWASAPMAALLALGFMLAWQRRRARR